MKNIYFKAAIFSAISMMSFSSCVKTDDYELPEIKCTNKFAAANHPLTDLATIAKTKPKIKFSIDIPIVFLKVLQNTGSLNIKVNWSKPTNFEFRYPLAGLKFWKAMIHPERG